MINSIFSDLKVLELSSVLAGPLVGTFFAETGAELIKIENALTGGDVTRGWKLEEEDPHASISAYYASANYGKRILLMNLNDKEQIKELRNLISEVDVVIVNFRKDKARKFGIDYETVKGLKSDIIYGEISGYGTNDDRIAYDVVLQAESGYMSMNGTEQSGPVKMPVAFIDVLTAHQMKEGILCALYNREKTGKGAYVHVSLYDTAISSLTNQASNYLMAGRIPQRLGTLHPNLAPYGEMFKSSDGKEFVLAVGSDSQFQTLCKLLDLEGIDNDDRFVTNRNRVVNRDQLYSILQAKFSRQDMEFWSLAFHTRHIPAGKVKSVDEVLEDENSKKLVLEEKQEGILTKRIKTVAFQINEH